MNFLNQLQQVRDDLEPEILRQLKQAEQSIGNRYEMDEWLWGELAARVTRGKLLRGAIVVVLHELLGGKYPRAALQAAAAVELYATGILMQDDVADRSAIRRGLPTLHRATEGYASAHSLSDAAHFGETVGLLGAVILYFTADGIVSQLPVPSDVRQTVQALSSRELLALGFAQLEDCRFPLTNQANLEDITSERILQLYQGKTGRYSAGWSTGVACALSQIDAPTTNSLITVAEQIGVLFQLRDDELGLFGNEAVTGKSTIDDIREGKRTLYWLEAQQKKNDAPYPLNKILGNQMVSPVKIAQYKQWLEDSGSRATVGQQMNDLFERNLLAIRQLKVFSETRAFFTELNTFVYKRDR